MVQRGAMIFKLVMNWRITQLKSYLWPTSYQWWLLLVVASWHYGSKQGDFETSKFLLSYERGSERSERASERVSAAEGASEASSPEQANE